MQKRDIEDVIVTSLGTEDLVSAIGQEAYEGLTPDQVKTVLNDAADMYRDWLDGYPDNEAEFLQEALENEKRRSWMRAASVARAEEDAR